jgi:hypothetical protein
VRVALYSEGDAPKHEDEHASRSEVLAGPGPAEVLIILLVLVLLFGAKRPPELSAGVVGLYAFTAETGA